MGDRVIGEIKMLATGGWGAGPGLYAGTHTAVPIIEQCIWNGEKWVLLESPEGIAVINSLGDRRGRTGSSSSG